MRQEREARRELDELIHYLHRAGLSFESLPAGWLAHIDQHAAAVRDILLMSNGHLGMIELAGYARGVQDAATESGWHLPSADKTTATWDWIDLRLAAVCLLAETGTSEEVHSALPSWQ